LTFGDEKMAVFSVVKLSELEGGKRIDAEYYKPEYLELSSKISSKEYSTLGNISSLLTDGDHGNPEYSTEGIVYVTSGNLNELGVDIKGCNKISYEYAKKIRKDCFTTEGDILLTTVGKIGISTIAQLSGIALSRDVSRIVIRKNTFYPEFISVYLNSKIGLLLTERESIGSVQKGLYLVQIRNLKIPKISNILQDKIKQNFLNAIKFDEQSLSLYSQAENLLLEELGLKDFKPKYEKTYTANLSDALSAHRIDAEYFQPAYEEVIEKLKEKNIEMKPLKKFILSFQKGVEPGSEKYQNVGKPFIRVSNISIYGIINRDQKYLSEELYKDLKENYEPKQGDILLTKDATPGIAYVVKEEVEGIISSGIVKLQVNDREINKEYLALCINSVIGKMQAEKDCAGSIILHWKPEQIKQIKIPLLPLSTQQKITSLIQKSHETRKKAKELLDVAKKAVEIAIEKSEKDALNYLSSFTNNINY